MSLRFTVYSLRFIVYSLQFVVYSICISCTSLPKDVVKVDALPEIYPDYIGVTIPADIAPLNFMLPSDQYQECVARLTTPDGTQQTYGDGVKVQIPEDEWRSILNAAKGTSVKVEVWGLKEGE